MNSCVYATHEDAFQSALIHCLLGTVASCHQMPPHNSDCGVMSYLRVLNLLKPRLRQQRPPKLRCPRRHSAAFPAFSVLIGGHPLLAAPDLTFPRDGRMAARYNFKTLLPVLVALARNILCDRAFRLCASECWFFSISRLRLCVSNIIFPFVLLYNLPHVLNC